MDKNKQSKLLQEYANPSGTIMRQNEIYVGHDAVCTIDELRNQQFN